MYIEKPLEQQFHEIDLETTQGTKTTNQLKSLTLRKS